MYLDEKIKFLIKNLEQKKYNEVIIECETLIKNKQKNYEIYNIYGLALQKQRLFTKSIEALKESIKINPKNFIAMNNLAISLKNNSEIAEAEKNYLSCLELNPNYVQALVNLSSLKEQKREINEAITLLQKAELLTSGLIKTDILLKLSYLNSVVGNLNQAKLILEKILKENPKNIAALINISKLANDGDNKEFVKKMQEIILSDKITPKGKSLLSFAIGNIYERFYDYEKAFSFFKQGNEIKKNLVTSNYTDIIEIKKSIINYFENFNFEKIKKTPLKGQVIFICGIPRSGTSLLEKIISSHSKVFSTGENGILSKILGNFFFKDKKFSEDNLLQEINSKDDKIQALYFKELKKFYTFKEKILTDKSMLNIFWIGFIKIFFPNSKILILKRNKRDIFLSIYKTDFNDNFMNWAYSKYEIFNIINAYSELISFFQKKFSNDIHIVEYKKLIDTPENEIKKIINICNLDWDPNCLRHDQSSVPIQTASLFQASKPIYKSSLNLSQNYYSFFQDVFDQLN